MVGVVCPTFRAKSAGPFLVSLSTFPSSGLEKVVIFHQISIKLWQFVSFKQVIHDIKKTNFLTSGRWAKQHPRELLSIFWSDSVPSKSSVKKTLSGNCMLRMFFCEYVSWFFSQRVQQETLEVPNEEKNMDQREDSLTLIFYFLPMPLLFSELLVPLVSYRASQYPLALDFWATQPPNSPCRSRWGEEGGGYRSSSRPQEAIAVKAGIATIISPIAVWSASKLGNQSAVYLTLLSSPGPKKVWKESPGTSDPGTPPRVWKKSRESLLGPSPDLFDAFSKLFQILGGGPGPGGTGRFHGPRGDSFAREVDWAGQESVD